jgi:putative aminopeptidase FrvX
MRKRLRSWLEKLLVTHSPSGLEGEIDAAIRQELAAIGWAVEQDRAGNLLVRVPGRDSAAPPLLITAHKDELGLVVRKIDESGRVWLEAMGGCRPAKYGEGPFDIVTRTGVVPGVLCVGSTHSSALSPRIQASKDGTGNWDLLYIDCGCDRDELRERGVDIGDRAVIGRHRKPPLFLDEDTICGYGLDDKGGVAVLLELLRQWVEHPPQRPVCVGFTANEEPGCAGGVYLCRTLGIDEFLAIEIAPIAEEYDVAFDERPVVLFKDGTQPYDARLSWRLADAIASLGIEPQRQLVRAFGSEPSAAAKAGVAARAACIGFPTKNTHGYEMTRLDALERTVRAVAAFVEQTETQA